MKPADYAVKPHHDVIEPGTAKKIESEFSNRALVFLFVPKTPPSIE